MSKSFPTLIRVDSFDFMNTGINPSCINYDFPMYATNSGNTVQPQYHQGQQLNYIQPQIQYQPQYPVSQNIMINNAELVLQYSNTNELNN